MGIEDLSGGQGAMRRVGTNLFRTRRVLPLVSMLMLLLVLALAGGQAASASEQQPEVQNTPGRDAAAVLRDLGKGKAAVFTFITIGRASTRVDAWTGSTAVHPAAKGGES